MRKLRTTKTLSSKQMTVRIGNRSSSMDLISDASKGVLAIPITDQEQMNSDMKAFINKRNGSTRI